MLKSGLVFTGVVLISAATCADSSMLSHGMFSRKPAERWEEAFITGNGTLGAMVCGKTDVEEVCFDHERLYWPNNEQEEEPPPDIARYVPEMQKMILAGQ